MKILYTLFFLFATILPHDSELFRAIQDDPYAAAGNLRPYLAPEGKIQDTKAPRGYKPFYFSYYGRHGSRYLTGELSFISGYVQMLSILNAQGALTEDGKKLLGQLRWLEEEHKGNSGNLTEIGYKEEEAISRRLHKRFRRIFHQCRRKDVIVRSSPALRSAMTGTSFIMELGRHSRRLEFDVKGGQRFYFTKWDPNPDLDATERRVLDSMIRATLDTVAFAKRFFSDGASLRSALAGKSLGEAQYEMMHILSIGRCLSPDADTFSLFCPEELLDYAIVQNARTASWFIHSKETGFFRDTNAGAPLINEIVCRAEEAINGNSICADLRFGHDSGVAPTFSFLNIEGYDNPEASLADSWVTWPAYKHVSMACNLSLVLYKNRKGDILVKILENERETAIPAISPFNGPYYKWDDFKRWSTRRI